MPTIDELALGLTLKMRRCAEAYASDPARNKTHAGLAAGCKRPYASVYACETLEKPKVKAYIAALTAAARKRLTKRSVGTVYGIEEILDGLGKQARKEEPTRTEELVRGGEVQGERRVYDTMGARSRLLDYHDPEKGKAGQVNVLALVMAMAPAEFKSAYLATLAGGNGDGRGEDDDIL